MGYREVENVRTGRRTYFVSGDDGKLKRVSRSRFMAMDCGGSYNSAVAWSDGDRRYFCHAR